MPEVKDIPLQWIRVNFNKHADRAQDEISPKTKLAPVDWYEDLDSNLKREYNQKVINKITPSFSNIYKLTDEEEIMLRDKYKNADFTALIGNAIAANVFHKHILEFITKIIGDYRYDEYKERMNINENEDDLHQRKIKSWALFSDSILEKIYQEIDDEHELDYKWNELSSQAISDDQQFAIDYFYNYRKMELGLDYNDKLIGRMELGKTINEIKEAALGFKPDATSRARSSVETMMSNLDKTMEYLQGNAFVKTYDEADADRIKELTNQTVDAIGDLLQLINTTPDTKSKGLEEIKLKNYKPLSEIDLDSTWSDTFGKEKGDRLAKKQHDLINDPVLMKARASAEKKKQKVEPRINPDYKALKNAPKIKALERERAQLMRDMEQEAEPEGGPIADRYGHELNKIDSKIANLKESINEDFKKGDKIVVDVKGSTHDKQSLASRYNKKKGTVNSTNGDIVFVNLGGKRTNVKLDKGDLKLAESVNEEHPDHTHGLTIKGSGFDWKKPKYKKGDKLKIKLKNGKEFDITFDSYSRTDGIGYMKYIDKDGDPVRGTFSLNSIVESINENEIPHQEEVDKFFSVTQNETHYLNQKPVAGQKGSRTHREIEPWDGYDLSNWNALVRKAKSSGKIKDVEEGTCGYSKDGKPKTKPAGPHLITKADLKEKIVNMIKKHQ